MIYLVVPDKCKWFLTRAESLDELTESNKTVLKLKKTGHGFIVISFSTEEDTFDIAFFPNDISDLETDEVVRALQNNKVYDRPFTPAQIGALLDYYSEDAEESE